MSEVRKQNFSKIIDIVIAIVKPSNNRNSMDITVEYKTPEKGSVEHKELDLDTEIKFVPDYELLDEEEAEELEDYFEKLNGFKSTNNL